MFVLVAEHATVCVVAGFTGRRYTAKAQVVTAQWLSALSGVFLLLPDCQRLNKSVQVGCKLNCMCI